MSVKSWFVLAFLLGGYVGGCVNNTNLAKENRVLQDKIRSLSARETAAIVLLRSQMLNEEKRRRRNLISGPGRLYRSEINIPEFINGFFKENPEQDRICFGRGWYVEDRSFD